MKRKRVGLAGFLHESNTFLSVPTTYDLFARNSLTRGSELVARWTGSHHELGGMLAGAAEQDLEVVPLQAALAIPSGAVTAEAYERLAGEMIEELRKALPLDGLLVALHGATACDAFPDADGELLRRIREVVGPELPVVVTLDLHANVSHRMAEHSTAIVAYRSNPHLDQEARGREAAVLMGRTLRGEVRPVQALETPPMLIHISRQHTAHDPAAALYRDVEEVLRRPKILSASVAMGFYYADVDEMGSSFLAVADGDEAAARDAAQWMARRAWEHRADFSCALPSPAEAVREAAAAEQTPVVLMDIGDNVGAGSPGDSTVLFAEILRQQVPGGLVILADPEAVQTCVAAGPGATVTLKVGGKTDRLHGDPLEVTGRVRVLSDGRFTETKVRHGGFGLYDQGLTAVLEMPGDHTVVLTTRRMAPMSLEQVLWLGIKPERKRVIVVKGVVAPRAAYEPIAASIVPVDTPGVTSDNPRHFTYRRRRVPMFPLEADAVY
jgi:microcystin degradation protein MlrC